MAKSVNNKRKWENNSRENHVPQPSCKRQNGARTHTTRTKEKKAYARSLPYCNKCKGITMGRRTPVAKQGVDVTCYECGNRGHVRSDCPKTKNQNRENQIWKGKARENSNFVKDKTYA
ncbi:reverse transcriptase domain-containing protein [Tanacetum coccineum]